MPKIKSLAIYLPLLYLAFIFAIHGITALFANPEYIQLVSSLGFNEQITLYLVYSVFLLDGFVAVSLLFGNLFYSKFPWKLLFIWAGCWPWVPRYLEYKAGLELEAGEAAILSAMAILAYYLAVKKGATFFKRKM